MAEEAKKKKTLAEIAAEYQPEVGPALAYPQEPTVLKTKTTAAAGAVPAGWRDLLDRRRKRMMAALVKQWQQAQQGQGQ